MNKTEQNKVYILVDTTGCCCISPPIGVFKTQEAAQRHASNLPGEEIVVAHVPVEEVHLRSAIDVTWISDNEL